MIPSVDSWVLAQFETGGTILDGADTETHVLLDITTREIGITLEGANGSKILAQTDERKKISCNVQDIIFIVHAFQVSNCPKISLKPAEGQPWNIVFETQKSAIKFLDILRELRGDTLVVRSLAAKHVNAFSGPNYNMQAQGIEDMSATKASASTDASSSPFKRLWFTGDYADFVVVAAGGQTFNVHRAVVCTQSCFFKAACGQGFLEAESHRIRLEEDAVVVEALLRELYGVESRFTGSPFTYFAYEPNVIKERIINDLIKIFIAADKYGMENICVRAAEAIRCRLPFLQDLESVIEAVNSVMEACPERDCGLRVIMMDHLETRFPHIHNNEAAEDAILEHPLVAKAMLRLLLSSRSAPITRQVPPQTTARRSSRIAGRN
ncbi:hypothetical protein EJ04DRAFT_559867 [Polyplosphaeria fusca]|uniref:BTB domain-containing protein n=1 Tax=Polyplosphaeria fusca TaxID=682080 RepID=A0A9P4RA25_9PLEO|nr:hypothetical protein EJ04DRAFT_559867 [Polyplosphaeria fusca]